MSVVVLQCSNKQTHTVMKQVFTVILEVTILFVVLLFTLKSLAGVVAWSIGLAFADGFFAETFGVIAFVIAAIGSIFTVAHLYDTLKAQKTPQPRKQQQYYSWAKS